MSNREVKAISFSSTGDILNNTDSNDKVNVLKTSNCLSYINNLQDEIGCIITIEVTNNGFVTLNRNDVKNNVIMYNIDYLYKEYKNLDDCSKKHITELLDFAYMGVIFEIFVKLGVLKEYWMEDKYNIEKFINLVDKDIKKKYNLSGEIKYVFDFNRAMSLYTFKYIRDFVTNNAGTKAYIKSYNNENFMIDFKYGFKVNENSLCSVGFTVKSFLDSLNVWYDLLYFNVYNNVVKFINNDGDEVEYVLPYLITYGKLSRENIRYMIVHYLLYILCINDYGCYCSDAYYKLNGETNLGMSGNFYSGPLLDFNKLLDRNFYKDIKW